MKKYCFVLAILLFLVAPTKVDAVLCDYQELANFRRMAVNVGTTYEPNSLSENATFTVKIYNLTEKLFVIEPFGKYNDPDFVYNYGMDPNNPSEITLTGRKQGESIKFNIHTNQEYCDGTVLYTFYVNIPYYNPYYKDELCEGLGDYQLCQRWMTYKLSREKFVSEITSYRDSLNKEEPEIPDVVEENVAIAIVMAILEFINRFYIPLLIITIALTITGAVLYIKKKEQNKL